MIVYVASVDDCGLSTFGIFSSEEAAVNAAVKKIQERLPGAVPDIEKVRGYVSVSDEDAEIYIRVTPTKVRDE